MMITPRQLERSCDRDPDSLQPIAARRLIVNELPGLARWILEPSVFLRAIEQTESQPSVSQPPTDWRQPPALPQRLGSCWALVVNHLARRFPLLRPAFVMPLSWIENANHDGRLPRGLSDVAGRVCDLLVRIGRIPPGSWGLHLARDTGIDWWDLSSWELDGRSAWPSLASGLILAAHKRTPDTRIWSTGEWDEQEGFRAVDAEGLKSKLELAIEFGVRTFFVPPDQLDMARDHLAKKAGCGLAIEAFEPTSQQPNFAEATRKYLGMAGVPPGRDEPFVVRCNHYMDQVDVDRGREYYITHLMPELACYFRQYFPRDARWTHLVTVASGSPELVPLIAAAVRPEQCLILYTEDFKNQEQIAESDIDNASLQCGIRRAPFSVRSMDVDFPREISRFVQGINPENVLFDLTPGNKEMSLSLAFDVAPSGSYVIYARHEYDGKRPRPALLPPLIRKAWRET
jgi:hypothetical protein